AFAIFVFSSDPRWTTYIVMPLLIIAGGFRFGRRGGLLGAGAMSLAYVGVALFRANFYGYAVEPERIVFTVTVNFLAAFLMAGLVRAVRGLRGPREAVPRQAAEPEDLDVRTLLREIVADHQVLAKQRRQWFALDAPPDAMTVSADRGRLRQALSNLVGNAIKYAPSGTPITVRAQRQDGLFRIAV